MSDAETDDGGPGRREVAYRLFAAEFDDADLEHAESDRERAPNYVITPTGGRVNRVFVVGVLTEVEPVSDEVLRARVADPTGAFVLYAGQYQPDERAFLDRADPPAYLAVTGKARTFRPDGSDRVFTSVRPESISEVDADTRDRWTVDAAERTIDRTGTVATALALGATGDDLRAALEDRGVEEGLAAGVPLALDHYGTTPTYLAAVRDLAIEAARHVAGEVDEVSPLDVEPDEPGNATPADLLDADVEPITPTAGAGASPAPEPEAPTESEPEADASTETASEPTEPASASEPADGTTASADGTGPAATRPEGSDEAGPGDFEPGDYEMDDAEREAIEEEYGTEFQAGTEVDEPGEADIETPEPTAESADASGGAADGTDDSGSTAADESRVDESSEADRSGESGRPEPAEEADLVDAAVDAMEDLDEGDGADRSAVIEAVVERTGADSGAVEDAVQEALMDGRCYEPDDATLKPI